LVKIFISVYPNATRLIQLLGVATVRPLKLGCKTTVLDWYRQNSNKILNKEWFAIVVDGAVKKYSLDCSVVHSFLACGLKPWNPENTDYLECFGKKLSINALSRFLS
jgi:hypothetical protein